MQIAIDEIKENTNTAAIIGEVVELKRKGNRYWGLCPFHQEKTPSFSVTPDKNMFYCFGCHAGGDALTFVQKYYGLNFKEALEMLADRAGIKADISPEARKTAREARRKREEEKELDADLLGFLKAARVDCFHLEKWIYTIKRHILVESDLNRPMVQWAIKNEARIEAMANEFIDGTDAEQLQAAKAFRRWADCQNLAML